MIGKNTVLMERDPESVEPLRWKIMVEVVPEVWKSKIHRPDNYKKGDTTTQSFWAKIVKRGNMVHTLEDDAFKSGVTVAIDPSIDMMNANRAFRWQDKHYVLCDAEDIIAVEERDEKAKQEVSG